MKINFRMILMLTLGYGIAHSTHASMKKQLPRPINRDEALRTLILASQQEPSGGLRDEVQTYYSKGKQVPQGPTYYDLSREVKN